MQFAAGTLHDAGIRCEELSAILDRDRERAVVRLADREPVGTLERTVLFDEDLARAAVVPEHDSLPGEELPVPADGEESRIICAVREVGRGRAAANLEKTGTVHAQHSLVAGGLAEPEAGILHCEAAARNMKHGVDASRCSVPRIDIEAVVNMVFTAADENFAVP